MTVNGFLGGWGHIILFNGVAAGELGGKKGLRGKGRWITEAKG